MAGEGPGGDEILEEEIDVNYEPTEEGERTPPPPPCFHPVPPPARALARASASSGLPPSVAVARPA